MTTLAKGRHKKCCLEKSNRERERGREREREGGERLSEREKNKIRQLNTVKEGIQCLVCKGRSKKSIVHIFML